MRRVKNLPCFSWESVSVKITPMSCWVFEMIKHEPGYNILDNGGLAPTHWRRIDGI